MKAISIKVMIVSLALVAVGFALAGTARAAHVEAEIVVPAEVRVGEPTEVQVALRSADDGLPLAGTPVTFYIDASFGGVSGEVELGRSTTDENGVATLIHEPRFASIHQIRAEYLAPGESELETISTSVSVTDVGSQLYRSTAGVNIPGLNVWAIIALVSTVWAILLFGVALRVVAIARAGDDAIVPVAQGAGG